MLYHLYDLQHALLTPARIAAELTRSVYASPSNPLAYTRLGRTIAAGAEVFERATRKFGEPDFGLTHTLIGGKTIDITEQVVLQKPFCNLLHFRRDIKRNDPQVLIVAPMSGHFATLLRGTVEALLPHHNVYITDWIDARQVPKAEGKFDLDDYIAYIREFLTMLGPDTHIIAVCQPAVPVYAAVALMEADNDPNTPLTMTLMGGPIDARVSKTAVTELAEQRPLSWFERTVVADVPFYYPGAFRRVYPGFVQLSGFMSMNLDRHVGSTVKFFNHLVLGDGESAESHRKFYNEYLAVMDITAEFYLQTVKTVFQDFALPRGTMVWRDPLTGMDIPVKPGAIKHTALLTVEGELDDISAHGQTTAAHTISTGLAAEKQFHLFQENVGHYGIFNGSRWRNQIMPRVRHFMRAHDSRRDPIPDSDQKLIPDIAPEQFNPAVHSIEAVRKRAKSSGSRRADAAPHNNKSGFHNAEELSE